MELKFRRASTEEDLHLLYRWANDPLARQNAFQTADIPFEDHCRWFYTKISDPNTALFICTDTELQKEVGQIRVEFTHQTGIISFSVDKQFRGRGYGTAMLRLLPSLLLKDGFEFRELLGKVKVSNSASQQAFLKAGYLKSNKNEWIEFSWTNPKE